MRATLLIHLFLCILAFSPGCMVMDEMDKAAAKMPSTGKESAAEAASPAAIAAGQAQPNPLVQQSKQWWDQATSLAPTELESSIVSCRLGGSTQFMAEDDCRSRGGRPGRL